MTTPSSETRPKLQLHERLIVLLFCGMMLCLTLISLSGPDRSTTNEISILIEEPAPVRSKRPSPAKKCKKSEKKKGKDL